MTKFAGVLRNAEPKDQRLTQTPYYYYFIKSTDRLRLISRVILRCKCAGMPVTRRGSILPLSVTNFFSTSGFL
jgi:hypothetical protein